MRSKRLVYVLPFVLLVAACGDDDDGNGITDGGTDGMDGAVVRPDGATSMDASSGEDGGESPLDGGSSGPDGNVAHPIMPCQGHVYQCGNDIDDDGDGLIESDDPDCLNPCDNNESGFFLNIPGGDSAPCKLDCYFDQDQGSGNDGCRWDHRCDPKEPDTDPACSYQDPPPPSADCPDEQTAQCGDFCGPLVPNGCDCFGCCELPAGPGGALEWVFIGTVDSNGMPTCSLDNLEGCNPCTPVADCLNDCGRCEICLGRGADELPSDCFPTPTPDGGTAPPDGGTPDAGTPIEVCSDPERQSCGVPGLPPCPDGHYCITGCCTYFG